MDTIQNLPGNYEQRDFNEIQADSRKDFYSKAE